MEKGGRCSESSQIESSNLNTQPINHTNSNVPQQQFCLKWNSYPGTVASQLLLLRASEELVDVTLACDGKILKAHQLVLSACSPYFMTLFKSTPCHHPVVFLRDVGFRQLVALIEFMYAGEVNVSQAELPSLLRTAEALQIRGLADTPESASAPTPLPNISSPKHQESIISSKPNESNSCLDSTSFSQFFNSQSAHAKQIESSASKRSCKNNNFGEGSSVEKQNQNSSLAPEQKNSISSFGSSCQMDLKPFFNGETEDETNESLGLIFSNVESAPSGVLSKKTGLNNVFGSSSDEEDDENENFESIDEDDDDGEIKEFSNYNIPSSSSQNPSNSQFKSDSWAETDESNFGSMLNSSPSSLNQSESTPPLNTQLKVSKKSKGGIWAPGVHGPQQCPYCPRVLSNVGNWRKHVNTMHLTREKIHKCIHCNSAFRTLEYLQKHYVRVHSYPQKMTRKKIGGAE